MSQINTQGRETIEVQSFHEKTHTHTSTCFDATEKNTWCTVGTMNGTQTRNSFVHMLNKTAVDPCLCADREYCISNG